MSSKSEPFFFFLNVFACLNGLSSGGSVSIFRDPVPLHCNDICLFSRSNTIFDYIIYSDIYDLFSCTVFDAYGQFVFSVLLWGIISLCSWLMSLSLVRGIPKGEKACPFTGENFLNFRTVSSSLMTLARSECWCYCIC